MIGLGAKYLTAAGFGRYRITAASLGSNLMFGSLWLKWQTRRAIMDAFGVDGTAVIRATNEYLNGIAASDKAKATALAVFINEDPMLVCSLGLQVEGVTMPIRWLVGDGVAYAITDYMPSYKFKAVSKLKSMASLPTGSPFAAALSYDERNGFLFARSGQYAAWYWTVGGVFVNDGRAALAVNTKYDVEMTRSGIKINGTTYAISGSTSFSPTQKFVVMGRENGTSIGDNVGLQEHLNYEDDVLVQHIIPCKNKNGNDYGILDLVTMQWFGNSAGSGAFAIAYTLQDGVTPWTPPTP
jgi:hypothetical protein